MVVTCEHCGARYRFEEDRISGRGARITCPRCRHVFVVYRDGESEEPGAEPGAEPDVEPAAEAVVPEEPVPDVNEMVFKEVGIASWKVKVGIGLVYDFDDYKTLRKYMKTGRVKDDDSLSHDGGKTWTAMDDLPDLAQFFVDTWVDARRAKQAADAPTPVAPTTPNPEEDEEALASIEVEDEEEVDADAIADDLLAAVEAAAAAETEGIDLDMDTLLEAAAAAAEAEKPATGARRGHEQAAVEQVAKTGNEEAAGHQFVDPFEALKKQRQARTRKRKKGKKGAAKDKGDSKKVIFGALAAAFAGLVFLGQSDEKPVGPTPKQRSEQQAKIQQAKMEKSALSARKKMQAQLDEVLENVELEEMDAFEVVEEQLIARIPDEFRTDGPGAGIRPPVAGARGEGQLMGGLSAGQRNMTARDHLEVGDRAARGQRWDEAEVAYAAAMALDPSNADLRARYGRALFRKGNQGQGEVELRRAAADGAIAAYKYLGHLAREQGDVAGANSHYQTYLRSGPPDSQAIQALVNQLSP